MAKLSTIWKGRTNKHFKVFYLRITNTFKSNQVTIPLTIVWHWKKNNGHQFTTTVHRVKTGSLLMSACAARAHGCTRKRQDSEAGFFLPTVEFLPLRSGNGLYRGIPRYTAKYRSNSNFKPKPLENASSNGMERYTAV
jgi:hypothetical protein